MEHNVFRVEDADGNGPYMEGVVDPYDDDTRPTPWMDDLDEGSLGVRIRYGFATRAQLCAWFGRWSENGYMRQRGFRVGVYRVQEHAVVFGNCQVAFDPLRARRVTTLELPVSDAQCREFFHAPIGA